jgi:hypothetical protein
MSVLLLAISLFPFRPGWDACQVQTVRTYYAYNQCFRNDVVVGARIEGGGVLLTCSSVSVICPKQNESA